MAFKLGKNHKLYIQTSGVRGKWPSAGAPAGLVELSRAKDVSFSGDAETADGSDRTSDFRQLAGTLKDASAEFEAVFDLAQTPIAFVKDAWLSGQVFGVAILDGPASSENVKGIWMDAVVTEFELSQELEGIGSASITFQNALSDLALELVTRGPDGAGLNTLPNAASSFSATVTSGVDWTFDPNDGGAQQAFTGTGSPQTINHNFGAVAQPAVIAPAGDLLGLSAPSNQMDGPVPDLNPFFAMADLDMSGNAFSGNLPGLTPTSVFADYIVNDNNIKGKIPDISQVAALQNFNVDNNQLEGSLPALPAGIVTFKASNNKLTGAIPDLASYSSLTTYHAADNKLTSYGGTAIPATLLDVDLSNNKLSSSDVTSILQHLDTAGGTGGTVDLSGNAPPLAAGLTAKANLETDGWTVTVDVNATMTWDVDNPSSVIWVVVTVDVGVAFSLSSNGGADITNEVGTGSLQAVTLSTTGTRATLSVPPEALQVVSTNELSAISLPVNVKDFPNLVRFNFSSNNLVGVMPDLTGLTSLEEFNISSSEHASKVIGPIPSLSGLTALKIFSISENRSFGGSITQSVPNSLEEFRANDCNLSGSIPNLASTALAAYDVSSNKITGFSGSPLPATLLDFQAYFNQLSQAAVDSILEQLDTAGGTNGDVNVGWNSDTNSWPSASGLTAAANLVGKGWTVQHRAVPLGTNLEFHLFGTRENHTFSVVVTNSVSYSFENGKGSYEVRVGSGARQDFVTFYSEKAYTPRFSIPAGDLLEMHVGEDAPNDSFMLVNSIPDLSAFTNLKVFQCQEQGFGGSLPSQPGSMEEWNSGLCASLGGTLSRFTTCTGLKELVAGGSKVSGAIPALATTLETFNVQRCDLSGVIPDLSGYTAMHTFSVDRTKVSSYSGASLAPALNIFVASNTNLKTADVDAILTQLDTAGGTNGIVKLTNTQPPTAAGKTAGQNLVGKGWTVSHDPVPLGTPLTFQMWGGGTNFNIEVVVTDTVAYSFDDGNGNYQELTGNGIGPVNDGVAQVLSATYPIKLSKPTIHVPAGDLLELSVAVTDDMGNDEGGEMVNAVPSLSAFTSLIRFVGQNNSFAGNLPALPASLQELNLANNGGLSGGLSGLVALTNLTHLILNENAFTHVPSLPVSIQQIHMRSMVTMTGPIPSLAAYTALTTLNLANTSINSYSGSVIPASLLDFNVTGCKLPVSVINNLLIQLDTAGASNGKFWCFGQTPLAPPSGAGATAKTNLIGKGWNIATD